MKLESVGIIISIQPFGERDVVARIFTRDFGIMAGMIRGGAHGGMKKARPMVGQIGNVTWNARLEQQLGMFHFESVRNLSAPLISNPAALSFMNSAFELLYTMLPEREQYGALYDGTERLLPELACALADGDLVLNQIYVDWEKMLLAELGYALNLSRCSNCGRADDLTHISPRTARAVCHDCAEPYLNRLLTLPVDLNITKYFLSRAATDMGLIDLPLGRKML